METAEDKQWASRYLLDPLTAPAPSEESGPGTHYGSTFGPNTAAKSSSQIEEDKRQPSVKVETVADESRAGRSTGGVKSSQISYSGDTSSALGGSTARPSTEIPTSSVRSSGENQQRRRGVSLGSRAERGSKSESQRPLDIIRKDSLRANRAHHLRKSQKIGLDCIDRLDSLPGGGYHHAGPYDPVNTARNQHWASSPLQATARGNREALKATPREYIIDSVKNRRPLDGVAVAPPGEPAPNGEILNYERGTDMMTDNGDNSYKRWPGLKYHPDDYKGKGEPSFTIDKALRKHKYSSHARIASDGAIEMGNRPRSTSGPARHDSIAVSTTSGRDLDEPANGGIREETYAEWQRGVHKSDSSAANTLGKKIGSLRRRHAGDREA